MRRFLVIAVVCLSVACHATIALVQSTAGGSGTLASTTPFTVTTSTATFGSNTTSGSLLICVVWATTTSGTSQDQPNSSGPCSTSGFTWTTAVTNVGNGSGLSAGMVGLYYIANASSMSNATTTTWTASAPGSGNALTLKAEFSLYEFSGISPSSVVDVFTSRAAQTGGTPTTSNLNTTLTDLVIVALNAIGSNISAGAGYTLGVNATVATVGQTQYQLNVAAGSIPTAFSGTETAWGALAVAFKGASVVATSVPRHKGMVF